MSSNSPFSIMLADHHSPFRKGIRDLIEKEKGFQIIGEANDGSELFSLLKNSTPDMVILDMSMPNLKGVAGAREIKIVYPSVKILILSLHGDKEYLQQAFSAGCEGYVVKKDVHEELLAAVENIRQGGVYISPRTGFELSGR